jgi:hypothetical protein
MEQTAYEIATGWLQSHVYHSKDNGYNYNIVSFEDACRAIRLALDTHTKLLTGEKISMETEE